jgi:hypothetical protein
MTLDYLKDIPFEYKRYHKNKDISLSDEIKTQFNNYYNEIKSSNQSDIDKWTKDGRTIKSNVKREIDPKRINKKSIYVEDYVQFIFGVSCLLYARYNLSQKKISKILGVNSSEYAKLDIYPIRSWKAYTKLDDDSKKKSLCPDNFDSMGIQIAECINKKIQAEYACAAFVGVSNDLDLFANIAATDKKRFVMTVPSGTVSEQTFRIEQNMGYARYLFATANNLEGIQGQYVSGKVKKKIISLLKMRDNSVLCKSERLKNFLDDGDEYERYILGDNRFFYLAKYRAYKRAMVEMDEEGTLPDRDYDDEYSEYLDISESGIDYVEDNFEEIYDWLRMSAEKMKINLLKKMSYVVIQKFDADDFADYLECLMKTLYENLEIKEKSLTSIVEELNFDEKILYAAIYWILSVCGVDNVAETRIKELQKYLKTRKLLDYFDAINKEFAEGKIPHTLLKTNDFCISDIIDQVCKMKSMQCRPALLYIDTDAYPNIEEYLDRILNGYKIVVVVHDSKGIVNVDNMQVLDEKLDLYYWEGNGNGI